MNKSLVKFLADFGPLLIFFIIYKKSGNDLSKAIPPLIISTIVAVVIIYYLEKKIPYVPLVGAVIISIFGGEPLLHPRIEKVLDHIRKAWPLASIRFITNGYLLKRYDPELWFKFGDLEIP